jgi:hypothetical protein
MPLINQQLPSSVSGSCHTLLNTSIALCCYNVNTAAICYKVEVTQISAHAPCINMSYLSVISSLLDINHASTVRAMAAVLTQCGLTASGGLCRIQQLPRQGCRCDGLSV